jgi:transposase-like protein
VAVAALRGDKTLTEIAQHYEVHPDRVIEWKRQLLERAADVFDGGSSAVKADNEPDQTGPPLPHQKKKISMSSLHRLSVCRFTF